MSHPCVNGYSGWFQLPAERGAVVAPAGETDAGNVAAANQEHVSARATAGSLTRLPARRPFPAGIHFTASAAD